MIIPYQNLSTRSAPTSGLDPVSMTSGPVETLLWVVAKVYQIALLSSPPLFLTLCLTGIMVSSFGLGKSRPIFQGLVLRKPTFSIQNLHFTDLFDPLADCTTEEASRWSLRSNVPQNSRGAGRIFHAFELGGEKVEIDSSADENLEIDALLFFSEQFCSRNKRKINAGRSKQKTNPPSSTVFPSTDFLFSSLFFERTADFGHVRGVRLQKSIKTTFPPRAHGVRRKSLDRGCVYTYPDIRISGYPDVRDPDIFGAFTRVGSKRFRRLHVSRHPDALYAAYSLSVGEIRKCFFFGQVACLQTLFHFFLSFCWCLLAGRQGQSFVW